ncbi:MAG: ABC transporter permease [Planctomycetales bacterium]|nr:ABC transporter permease [Planctomycetales bacterium]
MWTFVARRILALPALLLVVSFLTYFLMWVSPGDYYSKFAEDPTVNKEMIEKLRAEAGLDRGLPDGWAVWVANAVQGSLGDSLETRRPVAGLVLERLGSTLLLSVAALAIAWGAAIPLGVLAAVKRGKWLDHGCGLVAYVGLSIPSVFFAMLMILLAAHTGWFPVGDMRNVGEWERMGLGGRLLDLAHHLVLPAFVLGTISMAGYMRQMRGNMLECLSQDYVRTARAKGLAPASVVGKHALRPAINPIITLFGFSLAHLLNGSFLVEIVMNWPGMARLVVTAIFQEDQPVVMASVLMATTLLVLGNLIADVLLGLADPRIRLQ